MRLLFLGDSITDCDHCFTEDNLGNGFVKMTAELLGKNLEENIMAVNGGTDGFTFQGIYRKWRTMYAPGKRCIPPQGGKEAGFWDFVVILGGINEVCAMASCPQGSREREAILHDSMSCLNRLLSETVTDNTCVLVLEPFLFSAPEYLRCWTGVLDTMCREIRQVTARAAELSERVYFLETREYMTRQEKCFGAERITLDGIHPAEEGHLCLARYLTGEILKKTLLFSKIL